MPFFQLNLRAFISAYMLSSCTTSTDAYQDRFEIVPEEYVGLLWTHESIEVAVFKQVYSQGRFLCPWDLGNRLQVYLYILMRLSTEAQLSWAQRLVSSVG
ncbi:uncharacterized protein EKO05_0009227 [Ascochyta rabiei]|uniref:uncharacterized protein n=1 Tax=Didymella rabiei TaxID=5454 RepID=UPI0021FFF022|nr:uncharacterized protein EKO05_0009227 [Ascochyta rabiei]UPX18947.1 hypothetical protein EKO05_0009227 [Ascochyta rabiei]